MLTNNLKAVADLKMEINNLNAVKDMKILRKINRV